MKRNLVTSILMTIATTILLGILYPLVVTGVSQALFPEKSNGSLIQRDGTVIGSRLIGQPFTGPGYFHSRPSAAGDAGYDATASGGSNLGPTNQKLIARVEGDVARMQAENPSLLIPVDLVTASGSGLDPEITPAAAYFQVPRVARERQRTEEDIRKLVAAHVAGRQWDIFGEPRVNFLELNLSLESLRQLVCPSSFDLGENLHLVLVSTTEGEDKPLKYPTIFNTADVAIVTKLDLADAVEFDLEALIRNIHGVRPGMPILKVSTRAGQGIEELEQFLVAHRTDLEAARAV